MEDTIGSRRKKEFVRVWVRDPQLHKEDFWHTHIDYEICLHTNSICFRKKTSCVRRRYSEFVWLRQKLQDNALLVQLPKLPSANPFFSLNNTLQVNQRIEGLQNFMEAVLEMPLLLSDSHLHLFLQTQLSIAKMEACVQGQTSYTVAEAIQCASSSGLGIRVSPAAPIEMSSQNGSSGQQFLDMALDSEPFRCLSSSPESQQDTHT